MGKAANVLIFVALVGALVWWQFSRKDKADAEVLSQMHEVVSHMQSYPNNAEYLDTLLDREHPIAFGEAYTMGSRRRPAKFDDVKYTNVLFDRMAKYCRAAGKKDVAAELDVLRALGNQRSDEDQ